MASFALIVKHKTQPGKRDEVRKVWERHMASAIQLILVILLTSTASTMLTRIQFTHSKNMRAKKRHMTSLRRIVMPPT